MKNFKGYCSIALCLGAAAISAGAVFAYYNLAGKPACPAQKPADCPLAEPAAESPAACSAADLSAQVIFEGAAGTIYGAMSIKNISDKACTIAGNGFPKLNYDKATVKNLNIATLGLPSASTYTLQPGSAVYARIHFPNGPQCGSGIKMANAMLNYPIAPGIDVTFENVLPQGGQNRPEFSITACNDPKDITDIKITNLSDQPIQ
ncbi:MAG TPA: DUF4232 domain-containing protein [Candidatus Paceibacterota bacterium]|nr:DUF4232 domain-containing protein [Candidatus Pacearchaeota archaeon]HRZ50806.1 DUF4232 domain-containing protein [Candidatus Paceibacterota bacterium]HSA36527.1 DUF4232 domain-containing protein [Candidatus Paceibacterota bacterium]